MSDRFDLVRLAAELASRAAALQERAEAGGVDAEEAVEVRAELQRLEEQLAALEAEEAALDVGFDGSDGIHEEDPPVADAGADAEPDARTESEHGADGAGSADWRDDLRRVAGGRARSAFGTGDLGGEIGDLVDRAMETLQARLGALGPLTASGIVGREHDVVERTVSVSGACPVTVTARGGSIVVRPGSGDAVHVVAERFASTHEQLQEIHVDAVTDDDGGVTVTADWERGWRRQVRLTVEVPVGSSLSATTGGGAVHVEGTRGSAFVRTKGGSVRLSGTAGPADVSTAGGSIRIADHDGSVLARTSGGSIRVAGCCTGEVDVRTSGGSIRIADVDGAVVRADTSGGSVVVSGRVAGGSSLQTQGGSVTLAVPADSNLRVEGSGSSVHSDFSELRRSGGRLEGILGDGSAGTVTVRTSGGSVRIRSW